MNTYYVNHAFFSVGEKVVVYSGHFMVSSLENPYFINPNATNSSPSMQNPPLHSLIDFLRSTYHGVLISSKWRNFTGCSIPCTHKIRLNNAIWREWCRQHRHGKPPIVCKFNDTLNDLKLAKNNIIFERNFHNMLPIIFRGEYNKIRKFFYDRAQIIISLPPNTIFSFSSKKGDPYDDDPILPNHSFAPPDGKYYPIESHSHFHPPYGQRQSYEYGDVMTRWNNRNPPKIPVKGYQMIDFPNHSRLYSNYPYIESPPGHGKDGSDPISSQSDRIRQYKRHLSHLRSEKNRRSEIKNSIDRLYATIQEEKPPSSGKRPSYANILHEAGELLKWNQMEHNRNKIILEDLKSQLERKNAKNRSLRETIPTKDSSVHDMKEDFRKYLNLVLMWGMANSKLIICGLIMANTFKSLLGYNISQKSQLKDLHCWMNDNVFLQRFREDSSFVLQTISRKTSIIGNPSNLEEELHLMLRELIAENM